jgi:Ca2+-transporting ATPase
MRPVLEWHELSAGQVLEHLATSKSGLTFPEAHRRLEKYGPNELPKRGRTSPLNVFIRQFGNLLIIILLIATALSAFLGQIVESITIAVIVFFSILLGFAQEYRAERALEALRKLSAPTAHVLRDGKEVELPARELVQGDLILLRVGDRVAADARLIEAINLRQNESALTGESTSVEKQADAPTGTGAASGDRSNMVYTGTTVVYGHGLAVVVATAMNTEFGRITTLLQQAKEPRTPLQQNLDRVGRVIAGAALVIVGCIALLGALRGAPLLDMLLFGIALAVAAVPEALPAVVTISLALGVHRMVRRHVLIRRLQTVETLGCTSIICADKTGTLTMDEMTVREIWVDGQSIEVKGTGYAPDGEFMVAGKTIAIAEPLIALLRASVLVTEARLIHSAGHWEIQGDPTEGALLVAAAKAGLQREAIERDYPRVAEIPFSAEHKRMVTLHQAQTDVVACAKGAPEVILANCTHYLAGQGKRELDESAIQTIQDAARRMAADALRVLAIAGKDGATLENAGQELVLLGLVGMSDPPRPEARAAMATCAAAGIRPIMMTGDHPVTAQAVALELGLPGNGIVLTGPEMDKLTEAEFARRFRDIGIYARVSPEHKLRVVRAWQQSGHVVAMTGDGVNDAPALKLADVGVAMGITGTDVSKEAADMTLTDDNFASIVGAVEEGRGIFANIKKYLMYLLSSNVGEIGLMATAVLSGLPFPLTAVQILYVNLATDGLPALALAVDPPETDLMHRPPRDPRSGIFTRPVVLLILIGGVWSMMVNLGLFAWALGSGREVAQAMTMTFISLVLIQFVKAYNFRSDRLSVMTRPFANRWLNLAILWELLLLGLIVYVPFLQSAFRTYSLGVTDWLIVTGLALSVVPVLEVSKWMLRRHG